MKANYKELISNQQFYHNEPTKEKTKINSSLDKIKSLD